MKKKSQLGFNTQGSSWIFNLMHKIIYIWIWHSLNANEISRLSDWLQDRQTCYLMAQSADCLQVPQMLQAFSTSERSLQGIIYYWAYGVWDNINIAYFDRIRPYKYFEFCFLVSVCEK